MPASGASALPLLSGKAGSVHGLYVLNGATPERLTQNQAPSLDHGRSPPRGGKDETGWDCGANHSFDSTFSDDQRACASPRSAFAFGGTSGSTMARTATLTPSVG